MTAILLGLLSQHIVPVLIGVAGIVAWFYRGHSVRQSERAKQAQAELRARHQADEVEDAIAGRTPDANREELRKWQPKP